MFKSEPPFINGKFLYYGTNLASTIRSVIDNIKPHKSYKPTVNNITDAASIRTRGNSGVI